MVAKIRVCMLSSILVDHCWWGKAKIGDGRFFRPWDRCIGEIWCLEPKTSDFETILNKSRLAGYEPFFCFKTSKRPRCRVCMKTRKWPLWAFFRENVSRHEWWLKYVFTCYFHLVDHFWWGKSENRWWSIFRPWDRCIGEIWCLEPKTSDFVTFLNKSRLAVRAVFVSKQAKNRGVACAWKRENDPYEHFFAKTFLGTNGG